MFKTRAVTVHEKSWHMALCTCLGQMRQKSQPTTCCESYGMRGSLEPGAPRFSRLALDRPIEVPGALSVGSKSCSDVAQDLCLFLCLGAWTAT